jgi:dCTP deaminase
MTLLSDIEIKKLAEEQEMITPYLPSLIREVDGVKVLSYGSSSYGYDLRLSPKDFRVFRRIPGEIVDPKNFNPNCLERAELKTDDKGSFFILPANSYGLGVAIERLQIPSNITCIFLGKSSYARVGAIWNITPGEACMAEDTDILAKTGWKRLSEVIIGEEVLTLNPTTHKTEYKPIQHKQAYYFNGELLHFFGKYIDQLVTPQHRMWAGKRHQRVESMVGNGNLDRTTGLRRPKLSGWDFNFIEAKDLYGQWNYYLSRDLNWEGHNPWGGRFQIGKYNFSIEDWMRFVGAWMGDGSAFYCGRGNYIVKLAVVSKQRKREYYRNLLTSMGVNFHESKWGFAFQDKAVMEYLRPYSGAHNKHIPLEIKQLTPYLLRFVIEGMMNSDGNLETCTYLSVSERLIDDFQEICLKAGYNCTKWWQDKDVFGTQRLVHKARYSDANVTPNKIEPGRNIEKVPYSGMVYDVTVPNHIFLSRRNGRASWTGNSWRGHLTLEVSNSSSSDIRVYSNEGVVQALFLTGNPCSVSYSDRKGKYQDQAEEIVFSRV